VISPSGEIIAALLGEPGLLLADIDVSDLDKVRNAIPVLANRRF
jgi:predicted amidohydrolase